MANRSILMIPYDERSERKDSIINGEEFEYNDRFLLISNKEIPKDSRIYAEITITEHPYNKEIRHVPIYLGIHKEPSWGVLASDCCLGNVFYKRYFTQTENDGEYLAFNMMERHNHAGVMTQQFTFNVYAKVPIINGVIGVGIDMLNNTINLYSEGRLFYSFKPQTFDMNNQSNSVFLAFYQSEVGEHIKGFINLGRYKTAYLPTGYFTMYQEYFDKMPSSYDISGSIKVGTIYLNPPRMWDWPGRLDISNDVAPLLDGSRDVYLGLNHPASMIYFKNPPYNTVSNNNAFNFYSNIVTQSDHDIAYITYPMAPRQKVYFEFTCRGATMNDSILGIPLSIGITKDPNNINSKTFKFDLFHPRMDGYRVETIVNGNTYTGGNYSILNPSAPYQPNVIGVMVDKTNNTIAVYTDGTRFCELTSNIADFSEITELTYFFFEGRPDVFTGEGHVICNFDEDKDIPLRYTDVYDQSTIMSLGYYYTYTIRFPYWYDLDATIKVIDEFISYNRYIYGNVIVEDVSEENNGWTPGVNKLWHTYNTVSNNDSDDINVPDKSIFDIRKLMSDDDTNNRR